MDTSELYIKMCDCLEIQRQEPDASGEYMGCRNGDKSGKSGFVWLPRQGQIQEMMRWKEDFKAPIKIRLFHSWIFRGSNRAFNCQQFDSLEQLWLAFYMYEKHRKFWGKKGWQKSGK